MALFKEVKQDDGVITNYHRILYIMTTTNKQNSIAVISYIDSSSREDEKENIVMQPYQRSITYETDYDPNMTIETAYEYLKTLPQFNGAEDV